VDRKDKMFLLHLGAPAPKWRRNILSFRCTYVEKDHLILQEHLSGEGTFYPLGAHKWRRNILDVPSPLRCT
jgi:hypothetical protein